MDANQKHVRDHRYITLKVYTAPRIIAQEIKTYDHLRAIQSNHVGQTFLRPLIEVFHMRSPNGHKIHACLVHPLLGMSLGQLVQLLSGGVMNSFMARILIRNILIALDFLYTEAGVIHTG